MTPLRVTVVVMVVVDGPVYCRSASGAVLSTWMLSKIPWPAAVWLPTLSVARLRKV